jgi:hypothetical protein
MMPYIRRIQAPDYPGTGVWLDCTAIAAIHEATRNITLKSGVVFGPVNVGWSNQARDAWWEEFLIVWKEYAKDMQQRERMAT